MITLRATSFANFNEKSNIRRRKFVPRRFERLFYAPSVNPSNSTKVPSIQSLQIHIKPSNNRLAEWES